MPEVWPRDHGDEAHVPHCRLQKPGVEGDEVLITIEEIKWAKSCRNQLDDWLSLATRFESDLAGEVDTIRDTTAASDKLKQLEMQVADFESNPSTWPHTSSLEDAPASESAQRHVYGA